MRISIILIGIILFCGCTSSRAVENWRDGWALEQKGDNVQALRRYTDGTKRMGRYPGLSLNRIRLLAASPEHRQEAQLELDLLLKADGSDARTAAFAALWALEQGDVALARTRLAAAKNEDDPGAMAAMRQAEFALLLAEKKWQEAWKLGQTLNPETPRDHLRLATAAWNAGEASAVPPILLKAPECKEKWLLEALVAAAENQWPQVQEKLGRLEGEAVTPVIQALRAEAALHAEPPDVAAALRDAAEAARRDPADPLVTEVWAVAQLQGKQPQLARDLLAGLTVRGADWSAWYNLGLAQLKLGDLQGANQAFQVAAQRCPQCKAAVRNRDALAGVQ